MSSRIRRLMNSGNVLSSSRPNYIVNETNLINSLITIIIIHTYTLHTSRPRLHSADSYYVQPWIRTKFGEMAFSHADPAAWNSLPDELQQTPTFNLKTHLFSTAFSFLVYYFIKLTVVMPRCSNFNFVTGAL